MRRQKGGKIFYEARFLTSPEAVEERIRSLGSIPSPSQTVGQCAIDAIIVIFYYADGTRQSLWKWFFGEAPGGKVELSDAELDPERLRGDAEALARAFLLTVGARVLRILESPETVASLDRSASFSPSEETHGTTPSEVCSNFGTTLAKVLRARGDPPPKPLKMHLVKPGARSSLADYTPSLIRSNITRLIGYIIGEFPPLAGEVPAEGEEEAAGTGAPIQVVAMFVEVFAIASEYNPVLAEASTSHAIAVVQVNGKWYVADNEIGLLVPFTSAFPSDVVENIDDGRSVYFEVRYSPGPKAQYFLRKTADGSDISSTNSVIMLSRGVDGRVRPDLGRGILIMREQPGITGFSAASGDRTRIPLYDEYSPPAPPPAGPAAAGSGAFPFGGKRRKTQRRKKTRRSRRSSRGGRRLSSPK
jgi:hypothetical protein